MRWRRWSRTIPGSGSPAVHQSPASASASRQSLFTTSMPVGMCPNSSAKLREGHVEPAPGKAVLPELAAVVEEDAGDEEAAVDPGVGCGQGIGGTHHLRHVLHEPAPPRVVVVPRRRRPPELLAEALEEGRADGAQPGILEPRDLGLDVGVVLGLLLRERPARGHEKADLVVGEDAEIPVLGLQPVAPHAPLPCDRDELAGPGLGGHAVGRVILPHLEQEGVIGIAHEPVEVGLAPLRHLGAGPLKLRVDLGPMRATIPGQVLELGDADGPTGLLRALCFIHAPPSRGGARPDNARIRGRRSLRRIDSPLPP